MTTAKHIRARIHATIRNIDQWRVDMLRITAYKDRRFVDKYVRAALRYWNTYERGR